MNLKRISVVFVVLMILIFCSFPVSASSIDLTTGCTTDIVEQLAQLGIVNSAIAREQFSSQIPVYKCVYKTLLNEDVKSFNDSSYEYTFSLLNDDNEEVIVWSNAQGDLAGVNIKVVDGRMMVTGMNRDDAKTWNTVFSKYKTFILGVTGIATLTCTLCFILTFMKLGTVANNPHERQNCITWLMFTAMGAVGLGAVSIIFGFFHNII